MEIRELITKLGFNVDETKLKRLETGIESVKHTMEAIVGVEGSIVAGIYELTKVTSEYGEDVKRNALITGLSYTAYQKYKFAANQAGVENEEFTSGIRYLSRAMGQAIRGATEFKDVFNALHVPADILAKGDTEKIIPYIAEGFKRINNKALEAYYGMRLFGRGGALMASWMSRGSEEMRIFTDKAAALGVMTDEDVEASERFEQAQKSLMYTLAQTRNEIGVRLFPIVEKVIKRLQDWWIVNKKIVDQNLTSFIKGLASAAETAWTWFSRLWSVAMAVSGVFGGMVNVVRLLTLGVAALTGAKILLGLQALLSILKTIRTVQITDALTNPVVLLTAALFGLFLLAEDFFGYLEGKDSLFGRTMIGKWLTSIGGIKNAWTAFRSWYTKMIDGIWDYFVASFEARVPKWMQTLFHAGARVLSDPDKAPAKGEGPTGFGRIVDLLGKLPGHPDFDLRHLPPLDFSKGLPPLFKSEHVITVDVKGVAAADHPAIIADTLRPVIHEEIGKTFDRAISNWVRREQ